MYTDTRVRTLLRKGVIIFKTTLANNNYPFGVNRFWGKCDELLVRKKDELLVNTPYQLFLLSGLISWSCLFPFPVCRLRFVGSQNSGQFPCP